MEHSPIMDHIVASSSDEEHDSRSAQVLLSTAQQLRSAKRNASVALTVSAVACLCSIVIFVNKQGAGNGPVQAPELGSTKMMGLDEELASNEEPALSMRDVQEKMSGLMEEARDLKYGIRPAPFHLAVPSALHTKPSESSKVERQVPAGVQVFPLTRRNGFAQVVVPQMEVDGKQLNATFGWLPEIQDGEQLLVQDSEIKFRTQAPWRTTPPSKANVQQQWNEVRVKNAALKEEIAKLQASVESGYAADKKRKAKDLKARHSEKAKAVKEEVDQVVNVDEVSNTLHQAHVGLQKELKSPKHIMGELGKLFQ